MVWHSLHNVPQRYLMETSAENLSKGENIPLPLRPAQDIGKQTAQLPHSTEVLKIQRKNFGRFKHKVQSHSGARHTTRRMMLRECCEESFTGWASQR